MIEAEAFVNKQYHGHSWCQCVAVEYASVQGEHWPQLNNVGHTYEISERHRERTICRHENTSDNCKHPIKPDCKHDESHHDIDQRGDDIE